MARQATEIVALDDALEALTDRGAGDIDLLAGDEVVDGDLGADLDQVVLGLTRNSATLRLGST